MSSPIDLDQLSSQTSIDGWDLAIAGVVLIVAWILGRVVRRATLGVLARVQGVGEDLRQLLSRIAKYLVWLLGVGIALAFLGVQVQPLLAVVLIIAVIAVLALRGVAENFAASLVIQARHPIALGDQIEALDHDGTVVEINGRAVVIETFDGKTVHLPSAEVLRNPIVNRSVHGLRRSDIEVRLARPDDLDHALNLVESAARATAVATDPGPAVSVRAFEPDRVTLLVRVWHEPGSSGTAAGAAVRSIGEALRRDGIVATAVTPPPDHPLTPPPPV